MASFSTFPHLLVFLLLVAAVGMTVEIVDGSECSQALGECGSEGECDNLCKAEYEGEGSCVMNSCTCNYKCGPSVGPKEIKRDCNAGLGYCGGKCWDECCNSGCASKYNEGIGFCHDYTGISVCICQYAC